MRVTSNAHLYNCGDHASDVYFVESGQIKEVTYSAEGKECLLAIHAERDMVGELCLLLEKRTETAIAMSSTVLRRIPVAMFRTALVDEYLADDFLRHLASRMAEQQQIITNLVTMDSEQRLAATLLALGRRLGKRQPQGIHIERRITQEELSHMVGTTRSRVGYFLKRFRDAGLVQRTSGAFLVIDERSLMDYLDADMQL
jgi:CRP-like cAMP-binding protein